MIIGYEAAVSSKLDQLLGQSMTAVVRTEMSCSRVRDNLHGVLARLAHHFQALKSIRCAFVLEPLAASIEADGHTVMVPRLVVQCRQPGRLFADALTLIYVPTSSVHIELQVVFRETLRRAAEGIVWSAERGWYFSATDSELHSESHLRFLTNVLLEIGLFRSLTMELAR